jgi:hypothetical protein
MYLQISMKLGVSGDINNVITVVGFGVDWFKDFGEGGAKTPISNT